MMDSDVLKPLVEEGIEEKTYTLLLQPKSEFNEKNNPSHVFDWDDEFDVIRSSN
ncbi:MULTISPECIES: hypothetical protein [Legionella]|uniref:Uncharacterized protein n=1 Tax=Legionella quateirensis TaxID=45072 RepID=A0A378P8U8_9GAMM|nr:hypothetical protein [Legionella quateirensis]KTD53924.1 hypothetical protein Lqua_0363 [Legionella quateirensis]STY83025.1 Uncharacterised protein [Legionella quateirensis]